MGCENCGGGCLLLVVYVLSTGPVVGWTVRRQLSSDHLADQHMEMIESFYAPLVAIYDRCPPFAAAIDWLC